MTALPVRLAPLSLLLRLSLLLHAAMALALAVQPSAWRWVLAAFLANHLLLSLAGLWPRSTWLGRNWSRLPAASAARAEIALTIDDGPDPEVTPAVLDMLDRLQVKATFFCIGEKVRRHPALLVFTAMPICAGNVPFLPVSPVVLLNMHARTLA